MTEGVETDRNTAPSILVVMAHPDDIEHLAAGSVALWVADGYEVTYCVLTDGAAGTPDPSTSNAEVARIRAAEQISAAAVVGVSDVRLLGHPDGALTDDVALRRELVRIIREVRPVRVVTQSPEINWDFLADAHFDHRTCGEAVLRAVYPESRNPRAFPELADEGLPPWVVSELWMVGSPTPNHFPDVTTAFDAKLAALLEHRSQVEDQAAMKEWLRSRLARQAARGGLPDGALAEEFHVVSTTW